MASTQLFIEALHASPVKVVMHVTGAGATAISGLMGVAGCSKTLLNATVPYQQHSTFALLDNKPSKLVSVEVGRDLAHHAFIEARSLVAKAEIPYNTTSTTPPPPTPGGVIVGLGATCALQTSRVRRGDDAVHVSTWRQGAQATDYSLILSKDRSRIEQEHMVQQVVFKALGDVAGLEFAVEGLQEDEQLIVHTHAGVPVNSDAELFPLQQLLAGKLPHDKHFILYNSHGAPRASLPPFTLEEPAAAPSRAENKKCFLLCPGSFNPLHFGHTELATVCGEVAKQKTADELGLQISDIDIQVTYELALSRVGKASLSAEDALGRVQQFTKCGRRVAVTSAKLFIEKALIFPNHGICVGLDTMVRILDTQYYNNSEAEMIAALGKLRDLGCYFLVGGRLEQGQGVEGGDGSSRGKWLSAEDESICPVPPQLKDLVVPIPESLFRVDVSSTILRARKELTPHSNVPKTRNEVFPSSLSTPL